MPKIAASMILMCDVILIAQTMSNLLLSSTEPKAFFSAVTLFEVSGAVF